VAELGEADVELIWERYFHLLPEPDRYLSKVILDATGPNRRSLLKKFLGFKYGRDWEAHVADWEGLSYADFRRHLAERAYRHHAHEIDLDSG